ncbi:MAG: CdaR family protein [Proteobacteria bacterium]|nr:CdaR family protein [Pseudomonadota bacterium]
MARNRSQTLSSLGRSPSRKVSPASSPPPSAKQPKGSPPPPAEAPPPKPVEPPPERGAIIGWLRDAAFENLGLKFLSLVLAVTVFLLVNTDRDREITAHVGVVYTLPDDKVLVSERLDEIRVTIKGPWRKLRGFDERELDRVSLDLSRARGGEITLSPEMISVPSGMTITSISPRSVRVVVEKRVEKVVELMPSLVGRAAHGFVIAEVKAVPTTVRVRGGEGLLRTLSSVRTREISLDGRTDNFKLDTSIVAPEGVEVVRPIPAIQIQVYIDEELVSRKVTNLTVFAHGDDGVIDPAKWRISPAQVDVTLTGALLSVEKAKDVMKPVVRVVDGRGRESAEVVIEGLPPGVGVKVSPERVKIAPATR